MSNGDDEPADDEPADEEAAADEESADEAAPAGPADELDQRLTAAEEDLEAAETEADLDEVEAELDAIETDLEEADLPEPDDDEEDAEDPREDLESRLSDLRDQLEDKRGPYAEDVAAVVEDAQSTVADTRWTESGRPEVTAAVDSFLETMDEMLSGSFEAASDDPDDLAAALGEVADALEEADLDPDEDADTIDDLLAEAEGLVDDLEDAEEWDDLTVVQQLDHEGYYDVISGDNRKDYPPEWSAMKVWEAKNEPEPILLALDRLDSDFMEENILVSLKRLGPQEAFDEMHQRAQKRDKLPIEVLGKIGDERALDTLHEFIEGGGDYKLQKVTLRTIGEIGSEESTQHVANRLVADEPDVRSSAARALGLIGDTRAIEPLADVLEDDDADEVRASAAWALNQIGTERALDVLTDYADDQSYIVQSEAEKAV